MTPLLLYYKDTLPDGSGIEFKCEVADYDNLRPEDAKAVALFKWDILRHFPNLDGKLNTIVPELMYFQDNCGLCEFSARYQKTMCSECGLAKLGHVCAKPDSLFTIFKRKLSRTTGLPLDENQLSLVAHELYALIESIDLDNYYIANRETLK